MSRAARTGVRDEMKTSKLRTSPSISRRGSTSLVVGMFLEILKEQNTGPCTSFTDVFEEDFRLTAKCKRLLGLMDVITHTNYF